MPSRKVAIKTERKERNENFFKEGHYIHMNVCGPMIDTFREMNTNFQTI